MLRPRPGLRALELEPTMTFSMTSSFLRARESAPTEASEPTPGSRHARALFSARLKKPRRSLGYDGVGSAIGSQRARPQIAREHAGRVGALLEGQELVDLGAAVSLLDVALAQHGVFG